VTPDTRSPAEVLPEAPETGRRVLLQSFGCQMNDLDTELVAGDLRRAGWVRVDEIEEADVVLVNTCAIREHAEDKVWSLLGRARLAKELRPSMRIGVLGCMAQRAKAEIVRRAPHVDLVLGTSSFRHAVTDLADVSRRGGRIVRVDRRPDPEHLPDADRDVTSRPDRYRAYVTVMRGCDHTCTYCVVPYTRGPEVSRPLEDVLDEVRRLADDGVREVTFLGQNINTYGLPRQASARPAAQEGDRGLCALLERAAEVPGIDRLRFLTSNPFDMTEGMMRRFGAVPKVMPWLHIPAQSGSDRVLERMKRTYTAARYLEVVGWARAHVPGVEITSDFIVGFPGETDEDFQETCRLVERVGFVQVYVFQYSVRPNTWAANRLDDDVPDPVKRARNLALLDLHDRISKDRAQRLVGRRVEVLVEGPSPRDPTRVTGRDPGNRVVHADAPPHDPASLAGRMAVVEVTEVLGHSVRGRVVALEGDRRWTLR
jgi:tRNA-2-methylthio-N6-dimethylallyladenosine synthase